MSYIKYLHVEIRDQEDKQYYIKFSLTDHSLVHTSTLVLYKRMSRIRVLKRGQVL